MARLRVRNKFLNDGEEKFYARGVSYGPFTPNSRGERYPEPARTDADFALMRELGINLVRTYVPPPDWMFEAAGKHGLRLMVGMPWPFHMAFLDSAEMQRDIRKTIADGVRAMRQYAEVIFAYSLGNEIRSDIVRWHGPRAVNRFLRELYESGKELDPEGLFTYSNYPSGEYLELNFLDLVSFNVYLHREGDFRRYLTHLLAQTADRPLVLSETGMDTIREGEAHQAELLGWQSRAAFELGLSGFVVFAFTDEWHTGGAEITDWAFGLVTRERQKKLACASLSEVFKGALPPRLPEMPPVSIVVCAYNAAATIGACVESLGRLNYSSYEVIVIDDGSTDATSAIAERAGARVVRVAHQGLSAARNAGIAAAQHRYVAFIDADAMAERDWLYHLIETSVRERAAAAGGQNFPPEPRSTLEAAFNAAPGGPREVRSGDDALEQVCGCNMIMDRERVGPAPFDAAFTEAGDDVDFSWRLKELGERLAYAPAAVVSHRRRTTLGGYIRQQIGYGRAEARLRRKYPHRRDGVYSGGGWWERWFGSGARIYYGVFGRGLFQSLYRASAGPEILEVPLSAGWVGASVVLLVLGIFSQLLLAIGVIGIALTVLSGVAGAFGEIEGRQLDWGGRSLLAMLNLAGPIARNFVRTATSYRGLGKGLDVEQRRAAGLQRRGEITPPYEAKPVDERAMDELIDNMRTELAQRGARASKSDGYQPYDLMVESDWGARATLNVLTTKDDPFTFRWRMRFGGTGLLRLGILLAIVVVGSILALRNGAGAAIVALLIIGWGLAALLASGWLRDARLLGPVIETAAHNALSRTNRESVSASG